LNLEILVKFQTYCVDQNTDYACAATSILTGVKSKPGTLGVSPKITQGQCTLTDADKLESIAKWALNAKKVIGEFLDKISRKTRLGDASKNSYQNDSTLIKIDIIFSRFRDQQSHHNWKCFGFVR
jgi:hypothetical protein